jgi:uncharacterized membrane protein YfcA
VTPAVLLPVIVFLGFAVEAAAGFGATVVTVALAARVMAIDDVLVALLPVNMALSAWIVARNARAVDVRLLATRIVPLMALGMGLGAWAAAGLSDGRLKLAFGLLVVVLAVMQLVTSRAGGQGGTGLSGPGALVAGGLIHGVFACGGPLVVYYASRVLDDKARFRATLSALWLTLNAVLLVSYTLRGTLTAHSLGTSASMLLPLALGTVAGEWIHRRVEAGTFRRGVNVLLFVAGLSLAASTLG